MMDNILNVLFVMLVVGVIVAVYRWIAKDRSAIPDIKAAGMTPHIYVSHMGDDIAIDLEKKKIGLFVGKERHILDFDKVRVCAVYHSSWNSLSFSLVGNYQTPTLKIDNISSKFLESEEMVINDVLKGKFTVDDLHKLPKKLKEHTNYGRKRLGYPPIL
ncbi:hypothetical protein GAY31_20075 [Azospirillum brasilense]|nr:hypothetical protein [Azospirillum brasilense]